jgi:hypothetical protein
MIVDITHKPQYTRVVDPLAWPASLAKMNTCGAALGSFVRSYLSHPGKHT